MIANPADAPPEPSRACRAVIDIGTNSVKLLVAHVGSEVVLPLFEQGRQTRLGEGFFTTRRLQPEAIARTVRAVAGFSETARGFGAASVRIVATAAAREAVNGEDLLSALQAVTDAPIVIISGQREAELAFRGVCSDPGLTRGNLLVADVGGGSTELILGQNGVRRYGNSFPIGAVRLFEALRENDPPGLDGLERCRRELHRELSRGVVPELGKRLKELSDGPIFLVGVGGTAAILACMIHRLDRYEREKIESTQISNVSVRATTEQLWKLPLVDRRQLPGLPPERADVILTGCAIYEALLTELGIHALRPSTRGLRFGVLLETG